MSETEVGGNSGWKNPEDEYPLAFGKYVRDPEPLGEGGFGVVFAARHTTSRLRFAVKFLRADFAKQQVFRRRFSDEVSHLKRLEHRNSVRVEDSGEQDGIPYLVMEYVDGENAFQMSRGGKLAIVMALRIARQVADALHFAHTREEPIIHRDVKPQNILIEKETRRAVLTDFGLAKRLAGRGGPQEQQAFSALGLRPPGTLEYMAPEYADSERRACGPHSDVYSLGATLYELLCGRPPFPIEPGAGETATLYDLNNRDPLPLRSLRPDIPDSVALICVKAMKRQAHARFASANHMAEAIQAILTPLSSESAVPRLSRWNSAKSLARVRSLLLRPALWFSAASIILICVTTVIARRSGSDAARAQALPLTAAESPTASVRNEESEADALIHARAVENAAEDAEQIKDAEAGVKKTLELIDKHPIELGFPRENDWTDLKCKAIDCLAVQYLNAQRFDQAEAQFETLRRTAPRNMSWYGKALVGQGSVAVGRMAEVRGPERERLRQTAIAFYKEALSAFRDPQVDDREGADGVEQAITRLEKVG